MPPSPDELVGNLFESYDVGSFYDQLFVRTGQTRPHYRQLYNVLSSMTVGDGGNRRLWADRSFLLEDNLRTPSGVPYVLANRRVLKWILPQKAGFGVATLMH